MIPYEKQQDNHSCGPAALAMVYRSLGREVQQAEIWPLVGRREGGGRWGSRTHSLCQDALRRGLAGLIIRGQAPWQLLEHCQRSGLRCIINHRLNAQTTQRHFSVLLDVSDDHVVLHDPLNGPEVRHERDAFLEMWSPSRSGHAAGHILIALAEPGTPAAACATCGLDLPATVMCRACRQLVRLDPAAALGCLDPACPAILWKTLYCTHCDAGLTHLDAVVWSVERKPKGEQEA